MDAPITVPLWLFILLCVLAMLATLDRLLMPSVRWYLRRRGNRVIDELNSRLALRLEPFKLTRRESLIDRLMYDPEVIRFAEEWAEQEGLRRDGRLRAPRLGLLAYIAKAFDPDGERELAFVPVGINYDRVLEDRSLVRDLDAQSERRGRVYAVVKTLGFVLHNLGLAARRRWHRFGYASVRVGEPVFLRDYLKRHGIDFHAMSEAEAFTAVERLGRELMAHVGRAIPVLPVSLVARVMVKSSEPLSEFELKGRVLDLVARLAERGAHVHVPRADQDYAVQVDLRMLTLRRLVEEGESGLYSARKTEPALLRYYANAIGHLLDEEDPSAGEHASLGDARQ